MRVRVKYLCDYGIFGRGETAAVSSAGMARDLERRGVVEVLGEVEEPALERTGGEVPARVLERLGLTVDPPEPTRGVEQEAPSAPSAPSAPVKSEPPAAPASAPLASPGAPDKLVPVRVKPSKDR